MDDNAATITTTTIIGHTWLVFTIIFPIIIMIAARARTIIIPPKRKRQPPVARKRQPPVAVGVPFVGVLPAVLTKSGGLQTVICEQHMKLGSVFTLSSLGIKVTFLVGPKVSVHFFHGTESEISISDVYKITVPIFGEGVGYDVDNDTRNEQHRFFAETLRPAKLRSHVGLMVHEVQEYFAKWGQCGTVDLKQEIDNVLMLIASRCLLGKEVRDHMHGEVSSLFHDLIGGLHLVSMFLPHLPTPAHRRRDRARARLQEIFSGIARQRKTSGRAGDDMLQGLMDSRYKDGRRATTEAEVTGLLVALLFAGHHTSSTVTAWTAARLLRHAEWLRAATEEQRRGGAGAVVDYDALLRMDVLHRSVKEALRLHPEGDEYEIPAGRMLASPLVVNNMLPGVYRVDPDAFDPDRFAAGREEGRAAGELAYTSFGAGKHACTGEGYAYLQIKVILSHLRRNFELELVSPFPETENMISMRPKGEVMVRYNRRQLLQQCT
ncbi:hypothetical protein PVAP13_2KG012600 [Panicum virgatum]|uniref:Obtusifoliol 14-alpha demethylase n=1 Tax=Panicum virgatum TaxID=38727 RepID=A0A8T0VY87_PANVG|nr:hypothetical protein PVAP13_2KG012600 [Panicum virgatum]